MRDLLVNEALLFLVRFDILANAADLILNVINLQLNLIKLIVLRPLGKQLQTALALEQFVTLNG